MTDVLADAEMRYAAAKSRRARIEKAWKAEGSPLLGRGSKGQTTEHPLMRMLRDHDALLLKLAHPLRRSHAGPEPSGVIKPYRAGRITKKLAVVPTPVKQAKAKG